MNFQTFIIIIGIVPLIKYIFNLTSSKLTSFVQMSNEKAQHTQLADIKVHRNFSKNSKCVADYAYFSAIYVLQRKYSTNIQNIQSSGLQPGVHYDMLGVCENILRNSLNVEPAIILTFTKSCPRIEVLECQKQVQCPRIEVLACQ